MMNTLQNIIKELRQGSHLELVNEHFSNEIILNKLLFIKNMFILENNYLLNKYNISILLKKNNFLLYITF